MVKNLPAMQENWVRSQEAPLENGNATHSSIPGLENSIDCIVHGVAMSRTQLSKLHFHFFRLLEGLPCDSAVKNPPVTQKMWETWVWPLEEEMATPPNILTGKIPGQRSPAGCSSWGSQRVRYNWACTHADFWKYVSLYYLSRGLVGSQSSH